MKKQTFNWTRINSSRRFEELSLYLIDEVFKLNTLSLFLRPGDKQEGIDIKGFCHASGRYMTVQCKQVEKLSISDIKEIARKFKEGEYYKKADRFIITTTADLKNPKAEALMDKLEQEFKADGIEFHCWDINKLEEKLVKFARIVKYFFSYEESIKLCFQPYEEHDIERPSAVDNFIPRSVYPFREPSAETQHEAILRYHSQTTLVDLFLKDPLSTNEICLLGDPQEGKTTLLQQTAYELSRQCDLIPLTIELKHAAAEVPIISLLDAHHPYWNQMPAKDLLVILDGLDEVAGEQLINTAKLIRYFNTEFPCVHVIFSCRRVFYHRYHLRSEVPDHTFYELVPLSYAEINKYLQDKLGKKADAFWNFIERKGLRSLLYKPFFLNYLSSRYQTSSSNFPSGRIQILDQCVAESLQASKPRQMRQGRRFIQSQVLYTRALHRLSFALQLAGRNTFTEDEMQSLFTTEEMDILEHGILLSNSYHQWSFHTALFQEHLAGRVLAGFDFDTIQRYVSIGETICKVKTKWIQTLASCLSHLQKSDKKYSEILGLFENDNIELITLADADKFDEAERLSIIEKIVDRYRKNDIRPLFTDVRENNIGGFIQDADTIIAFLLSILKGNDSLRLKITCWTILRYCTPRTNRRAELTSIALQEINATANGYYAGTILETLTVFSIGDEKLIDELLLHPKLLGNHEYRDGLYSLILKLELVDRYYDFGLNGFQPLFQHNKGISHAMSEKGLEDFLLATNSPHNLKKLLRTIAIEEWLSFYRHKASFAGSFVQRLTDKAVSFYALDPTVSLAAFHFYKKAAARHSRQEYAGFEKFFYETGTVGLAIQLYFLEPVSRQDWEIFSMIDESCFDYLLFLADENIISQPEFRQIIGCLRYDRKNEIAEALAKIANEYWQGQLYEKESASIQEYYRLENKKIKNDILYFKGKRSFTSGVKAFFKEFGKVTAPHNELYIDEDARHKRQQSASNVVTSFLFARLRNSNVVYQTDCLNFLSSDDRFEDFRAMELLSYNYSRAEIPAFKEVLQNYYYKYIDTVTFRNCFAGTEDYYTAPQNRIRILTDIFKKFSFTTEQDILIEMIWADMTWSRDGKETLTEKILAQLDEDHKEQLPKRIMDHITSKIKHPEVLENHLELCRKLHITDAVKLIPDMLASGKIRNYFRREATNIFLELGGDKELLLPVWEAITDYSDYYFWELVIVFMESHQSFTTERLLKVFEDPAIDVDVKTKAAQYLAAFGIDKAFAFLVDRIRKDKRSPFSVQTGFNVHNVDTDFGLSQMQDLSFMILDKDYYDEKHFHDSARNILLEFIAGFASKSETDLLKVDRFLRENYEKHQTNYSNAKDLLWYAERHLDQFRQHDRPGLSLDEIIPIIQNAGL